MDVSMVWNQETGEIKFFRFDSSREQYIETSKDKYGYTDWYPVTNEELKS